MPITENEYTTKINQSTGERTIEKNENNSIEFKDYDNADIAKMYFDDYLKQMISNQEKAYNLLDKQYRETKFDNYNGFVQYINANREKLELTYKMETLDNNDFEKYSDYLDFKLQHSNLGIKKYSIETYESYVQYTCQDAEGNYYIFSAQYPMDYSVVLDVYTTDTPYFKNMYSRSTDQNKAKLNLEKIQEAIAQMFEVELTRQHGTDGKERYDAKHQFIVLKKENISMIKKEPHEMPLVEVQYWTRELEKMCVGGELAYAKYKNKDLQGIFELYKKNPQAVFEQLPTCYEIKGRTVRQLEHEETLFKMYPELKKPEAEPEI